MAQYDHIVVEIFYIRYVQYIINVGLFDIAIQIPLLSLIYHESTLITQNPSLIYNYVLLTSNSPDDDKIVSIISCIYVDISLLVLWIVL